MKILFLLLWLPLSLWAMVIDIVPLRGNYRYENLAIEMAWSSSFLNLGKPLETVENIFDASRYCELYRTPYLIFGSIDSDDKKISIELNLYDHKSRSVGALFYGSDRIDQSLRLASHMVDQVESFLEARDLINRSSSLSRSGPLSIPISGGYWLPLDGESIPLFLPLGSASLGLRFSPFYEIFGPVLFHFGAEICWTYSKNNREYEDFNLHRLYFHLPLEISFQMDKRNSISFSLSPLYRLEILQKRRLNEVDTLLLSHSYGLIGSIAYHYRLSRWFSAGLILPIDIVFTDRTEISLRPQLSLIFHGGDPRRSKK